MSSNTPLFSRRQLNMIIAATAIVIALLSIPTQSGPTIERVKVLLDGCDQVRFSAGEDRAEELLNEADSLVVQLEQEVRRA